MWAPGRSCSCYPRKCIIALLRPHEVVRGLDPAHKPNLQRGAYVWDYTLIRCPIARIATRAITQRKQGREKKADLCDRKLVEWVRVSYSLFCRPTF